MAGFTEDTLLANGLLPICLKAKSNTPDIFVDDLHAEWDEDPRIALEQLARKTESGQQISISIYQRCVSTSKRGITSCYFPLTDFQAKAGKWSSELKEATRQDSRETALAFKAKNLPVLRKYMMGDVNLPIWCLKDDFQCLLDGRVDDEGNTYNIWEQHHFVVIDRASVQKEGSDPGEILRSTDFTLPSTRSRMAIEDMMRTVFLSPSAHKDVHNRWRNSDVTNYKNHELPWALRNESNWNEFTAYLVGLGYSAFPDYLTWMKSLTLAHYGHNQ